MAGVNTYDVGQPVQVVFSTRTPPVPGSGVSAGTLVDPGSVTLRWIDPLGNLTTWTLGGAGSIQHPSVGFFYALIDTTLVVGNPSTGGAGRWRYRWRAASPLASFDGGFVVVDSSLK